MRTSRIPLEQRILYVHVQEVLRRMRLEYGLDAPKPKITARLNKHFNVPYWICSVLVDMGRMQRFNRLNADDYDRRLQFVEEWPTKFNEDPQLEPSGVRSDEANFHLSDSDWRKTKANFAIECDE
ncbi:hypothetical protein AVEN_223411-1 [Araneus ventricosus]|uniref:Uncharacterized protein n=1 Tax=Araneus ventricosus TaxID=182803 RepID=A0A4Y2K7H4_ARAVE|nr:hypothetical protein AVEN_223411-1 [Araneus ventricosus]